MSNNAAVCPGGGEIGRAQYTQALAARVEPTVDMNPVLLKPQGNQTSQIIVRGKVEGVRSSRELMAQKRELLWPVVEASLTSLRQEYDLIIAEGAGSPAEVNLRHGDIVNMAVARATDADVLLVADIDRGGAFASLLGTWAALEPEDRALFKGFILNRFRGDASLLEPAPTWLREQTGVPTIGVVHEIPDLGLAEEDAATLTDNPRPGVVEIAVIRLPHIANYDEFGPLAAEPGVSLRYVASPEDLRAPDLVILPGSKTTIPDLLWLQERGLDQRIKWLADTGTPILGICGGFQMLGERVLDPDQAESPVAEAVGLNLLTGETTLTGDKTLRQTSGQFFGITGFWGSLGTHSVQGYEIHLGRTSSQELSLLTLGDHTDGAVRVDGLIAGSYLHGLLENQPLRRALVERLASRRGYLWRPSPEPASDPYDRLADIVERSLDLSGLASVRGLLRTA
jgi:adenosylcobyric acid synthase